MQGLGSHSSGHSRVAGGLEEGCRAMRLQFLGAGGVNVQTWLSLGVWTLFALGEKGEVGVWALVGGEAEEGFKRLASKALMPFPAAPQPVCVLPTFAFWPIWVGRRELCQASLGVCGPDVAAYQAGKDGGARTCVLTMIILSTALTGPPCRG